MKKSQILAALALAFALGVAAPVATVTNVNAISFADASVEGSKNLASGAEVANAMANAKKASNYETAMALVNTYDTFTKGVGDGIYVNSFDGTAAFKAAKAIYKLGELTDNEVITGIPETGATVEETQAVIDAINAYAKYTAATNLNTVASSETKDKDALISAIKAYYVAFDTPEANQINFSDDTTIAASFDSLYKAINGTSEYGTQYVLAGYNTKYTEVAEAVTAAEQAIKKYNASLAVFDGVFTDSILTAAGKRSLAANAGKPEELSQMIYVPTGTAMGYQNQNFIFNLDNLVALNTAIEAATPYDSAIETTDNWNKIEAIAVAYKTATDSDALTTAVMIELAGASTDEPGEDIDYTKPRPIPSKDGTVTIYGIFPEGVEVRTTEVKSANGFDKFGAKQFAAYDIVLVQVAADGSESEYDLAGQTVTVTIAVPSKMTGTKKVYHVSAEGELTEISATINNEFARFETNHFSIYAIVEDASTTPGEDDTKPTNPTEDGVGGNLNGTNTGIMSSSDATAKTSVSIMAAIATALTAAGAAIIAFRRNRAAKK